MRYLMALVSAAFCLVAGAFLVTMRPSEEGKNSVFFAIAFSMGLYFIGKGIYVGAALWPQDAPPRAPQTPSPPKPDNEGKAFFDRA